ncbi:hypothetical protein GL263_12825 [Streptomyces durbertensis]|uniref:Uncharacterized protein n=1 Tax=Streptomyces durbertensis TaxID=2448886 RepID=A0ABR6EGY2_9ACTN|nr:hypothetical protein [Streptomyces durbertensis]
MNELRHTVGEALAAAGFTAMEVVAPRNDLIPVIVAWCVTLLRPEDGRRDVILGHDKPGLTSALNTTWGRLARESGLLAEAERGGGELVVGLDLAADARDEPEFECQRWVRVSVRDSWDIAGAGCESGVLGAGRNNPSFVMSSLDGRVLMAAGYWQVGVGFAVLADPGRVAALRGYARRLASLPSVEAAQRDWAQGWARNVGP